MLYPSALPNLLAMLHVQHHSHTSKLGDTHKELCKQHRKLAGIELDLIQRHERNLTRREKKRLQWSRANTKTAVKLLELQQAWLHGYLRHCHDLIAATEGSMYSSPGTPWSAHTAMHPFSPIGALPTPVPWAAAPMTAFQPRQDRTPQYWDLSMLRERRQSSPLTLSGTADSGFFDTQTHDSTNTQRFRNPFSSNDDAEVPAMAHAMAPWSSKFSTSETDNVPELTKLVSPATTGAEAGSPHRRRFSENATQLIESRLAAPKAHHGRGSSTGATPILHRTLSAHPAIE